MKLAKIPGVPKRLLPAGLLVLSLAAAPLSQSPAPAQKSPVIKSNVDEVLLDLVVRDKHGHAMRDLRPEEIQVNDDGAAAKITSLRLVTRSEGINGAPNGPVPHLVSLIFDHLHADSSHAARRAAEELFKETAGGNVLFSVWRLSGQLDLFQMFTADQESLKRAVTLAADPKQPRNLLSKAAQAGQNAASIPEAIKPFAAGLLKITELADQIAREENASAFVSGFLALIRQQASMPGRKTIVYFSDGSQLASTKRTQFQSVIGAANRASVSIYAVDTSGIDQRVDYNAGLFTLHGSTTPLGPAGPPVPVSELAQPVMSAADPDHVTTRSSADMTVSGELRATNTADHLPMRTLAEQTGGLYINAARAVGNPLRRVAEDIGTYYEAAYTPKQHIDYDGHFRTIVVKVNRPHAEVQARSGYFAIPPNAGVDVRPFELPMLKALAAPQRTLTIPFQARVLRFGQERDGLRAELVLEIPLSEIEYQEDQTTRLCTMHMALLVLVKSENGQAARTFSEDLPLETALENSERVRAGTFTFQRAFTAKPGKYALEIAVSDILGKQLSTATVPFLLEAQANGLGMSDLSLVRRLEPLPANSEAEELLSYHDHKVVPRLSTASTGEAKDVPVFFTIYPDAKSSAKPSVSFELKRGDALVARSPLPMPNSHPGDPIALMTAISTKSLEPANYEIVAKATQGSLSREETLHFEIRGDGASQAPSQRLENTGSASLIPSFLVEPKLLEGGQKPGDAEVKLTLAAASQRAIDYRNALPNFTCMSITRRSVKNTAKADWKQRDITTEFLRFVDGNEEHRIVKVNGESQSDSADRESKGIQFQGEFGSLLDAVFSTKAQAHFEWQGFARVNGIETQVFKYEVTRRHSLYALGIQGLRISVAYRGFVYIDPNTLSTRRVSIEAEEIPQDFPIRESTLIVDYSYFSIGAQQYLLPGSATLYARQGKRHLSKSEKQFRNYRKYASESRIKFD